MYESAKKVKNDIETFLKEDEEHQNDNVYCVLINLDTDETITIAGDGYENTIIFTPYTTKENGYEKGYSNVPEWDFSFDSYVFEELEKGYFVGYMSDDMNYGIWNSLKELYPYDIDHKDGVQSYLQYCADNGITKTYLDEKTGFDTPDAMQYFEGLAINETMTYKGYVIEADDLNLDNPKENLVNIYESNKDFEMKEPIETVSLNTIGLKQNIKEYIDDYCYNKGIIDEEHSYFAFVLGYDLLNEEFKNSPSPECDITYDFCIKIADNYLKSDYFKDTTHSGYEMFVKYVNENKFQILKDYEKFIGEKNLYFKDNKKVLETGLRGETPVALIEWKKGGRKEYVIAVNYTFDKDKVYWSRGYYYTDINKVKYDFDKVKNGEYLPIKDKEKDDAR